MKFSPVYESSFLLQGFRYMDPSFLFNRTSSQTFRVLSEVQKPTSFLIGDLAENLGILLCILKDEPQIFRREFCTPSAYSFNILPSTRIDYADIGRLNYVKRAYEFKNSISKTTIESSQITHFQALYSDRLFLVSNSTSVHTSFIKTFLDTITELALDSRFEEFLFEICHILENPTDHYKLQKSVDILERVIDTVHYQKKPYQGILSLLDDSIKGGRAYPNKMNFVTNMATLDDRFKTRLIQTSIKPYLLPENINLFTKFLIRGVRPNDKLVEIQAMWSAPKECFSTGTKTIHSSQTYLEDLTEVEKIMTHTCSNLDFWNFLESLNLPLEIIARSKKISIDYIK